MTNNHHTKPTPDEEESYNSNNQQQQQRRRRIHLNHQSGENPSRQVSPPPTTLDAALRQQYPNVVVVVTPTHQSILGHRPLDIESLFGSLSSMRNGNGRIDAVSTSTSAPLSHQQLMHFLDRALEICDECLDDMNVVENRPDPQ